MSSWDDRQDPGPIYAPSVTYAGYDHEIAPPPPEPPPRARPISRHITLFIATCIATFVSHQVFFGGPLQDALIYSGAIMTILTCHEFGHFLQARRYGVAASLPIFIPWVPPLGTMGAVILMSGRMPNRKALFDIGISGPLAGMVPLFIFLALGLSWTHSVQGVDTFNDPVILKMMAEWFIGPLPPGHVIVLNPLVYAGWVGLLVTSLNLFPIGQLDGGHILYAILRKRAHVVATLVLLGAIVAVIATHNWGWSIMLALLIMIGPRHPPTTNDEARLGFGRTLLGWLTLMFVVVGFTPVPFNGMTGSPEPKPQPRNVRFVSVETAETEGRS